MWLSPYAIWTPLGISSKLIKYSWMLNAIQNAMIWVLYFVQQLRPNVRLPGGNTWECAHMPWINNTYLCPLAIRSTSTYVRVTFICDKSAYTYRCLKGYIHKADTGKIHTPLYNKRDILLGNQSGTILRYVLQVCFNLPKHYSCVGHFFFTVKLNHPNIKFIETLDKDIIFGIWKCRICEKKS